MVEWGSTASEVWAVGEETEVTVGTTDWRSGDGVRSPLPADAVLAGSAAGLRVPATDVSLAGSGSVPGRLPEGQHLLSFDAGIETLVRFEGPARATPDGDGLAVEFPGRTAVSVGFRAPAESPATVSVPATPSGVATALSHAGAALRTTTPDCSHPAYRGHPPLLELGGSSVPAAVREAAPDTGVELVCPPDLDHLFVAAPLAFYLGADVRVGDVDAPALRAPGVGYENLFAPLPEFEREVAALLRRVVFLDSVVRERAPARPDLRGEFGLDADRLRGCSPAERVATYSRERSGGLRGHLPEWHLSTYVAPEFPNARALPYLLDRLSLVYLPSSSALDGGELLRRTLDDFYRGDVATVERLAPELRAGSVHAWLAEGTPVDAFKTTTAAHEHRLADRGRREQLDLAVVLNDDEMVDERAVADVYRESAAGIPVNVAVHESLSRRQLADLLERPHDFVHFVGHCEVDGLVCPDGHLSADDLVESGARTFFLNACGSYYEGLELVERGSVAGAVTLARVLNEQALTVGTAFARLLMCGFGIERALMLARRRIMMGKDYAVVGDGAYALAPPGDTPAVARVTPSADGFEVAVKVVSSRSAGRTFRDPFGGAQLPYGSTAATTLDRAELMAFLDGRSVPVVFDGDFHWSEDLLAGFRGPGPDPGAD